MKKLIQLVILLSFISILTNAQNKYTEAMLIGRYEIKADFGGLEGEQTIARIQFEKGNTGVMAMQFKGGELGDYKPVEWFMINDVVFLNAQTSFQYTEVVPAETIDEIMDGTSTTTQTVESRSDDASIIVIKEITKDGLKAVTKKPIRSDDKVNIMELKIRLVKF